MNSRKVHILIGSIIFFYPALIALQGIDFTDFGYWLSCYSLLYKFPESIGDFAYLNYLSLVLGNLGMKLTPLSGAFNAKLAFAIITTANLALLYRFWRSFLDKTTLLVFLLLTQIFLIQISTHWISYNDLTGLANTIILIVALKTFSNPDRLSKWVLLGGFCSLGFWVRFPNILNLAIPLVVFLFVEKKRLKYLLSCGLGYSLVSAGILAYMGLNGHFHPFISGLDEVFHISSDPETTYESSMMLSRFLLNSYHSMTFALVVLAFAVLASKIFYRFIVNKPKATYYSLLFILSFVISYLLNNHGFQLLRFVGYRHEYTYLLTFLALLAYPLIKNDKKLLLYFALSIIILFITPMGSDRGFMNSYFGSYPIVVGLLCIYWKQKEVVWPFNIRVHQHLIVVALVAGVYLSLKNTFYFKYRDMGKRTLFTYGAGPKFEGLYTTFEREKVIRELVSALAEYTTDQESLLEYNNIPMIHYITQTRPYLRNAWSLIYTSEQFIRVFEQNVSRGEYPDTIVRPLYTARSHTWPKEKNKPHRPRDVAAIEFTNDWIVRNNYKVVWKNSFFEILKK